MALADELERIAALSGANAVLAGGGRSPATGSTSAPSRKPTEGATWLAYDADGEPVDERLRVRDAVSIIALCELAAETAAGGDLDELRSQLAALRVTENPPGIEEAEEAALELQHVLGAPPALATPARLDEIGSATTRSSRSRSGAPSRLAVRRGDEGRGRGRSRRSSARWSAPTGPTSGSLGAWKAAAFGFPFGGDPEDLLRGIQEFAAQQAESVQEAQREQFATLTLNTAVELTAAALKQVQPSGSIDEQAVALRDAMRVLFPEAVALVSAARQGFMRESR